MKEKLPRIAMLAVSVLGAAACDNQENGPPPDDLPPGPPSVEVTNISDRDIGISDNPTYLSAESQLGFLPAGASAVALCVEYNPEYPTSTSVLIVYEEGDERTEGYISTHTAGNKQRRGGEPLIEPDVDHLRRTVPPCDKPNKQPDQDQQHLEAAHWSQEEDTIFTITRTDNQDDMSIQIRITQYANTNAHHDPHRLCYNAG